MKPSTSSASFSPFERTLLKSLRPLESASLLLLVWVCANKTKASNEDWHYLGGLARKAHLEQDLPLLIETVRGRRLDDLKLAAEILRETGDQTRHLALLRSAIGLAASEGPVDAGGNCLLGFLADLCNVPPAELSRLHREVTGRTLVEPADPDRRAEGSAEESFKARPGREAGGHDSAFDSEEAPTGQPRPGGTFHWRHLIRSVWQRQTSARFRLRQWRRIRLARQAREHQARQRAEREWAEHQERARQERAQWQAHSRRRQQESRDRHAVDDATASPFRKRLALQALELDEHATRSDIKRAYRRMAQRHHPDRHLGLGERRVALASQRFQRIKDAYEYLTRHA